MEIKLFVLHNMFIGYLLIIAHNKFCKTITSFRLVYCTITCCSIIAFIALLRKQIIYNYVIDLL